MSGEGVPLIFVRGLMWDRPSGAEEPTHIAFPEAHAAALVDVEEAVRELLYVECDRDLGRADAWDALHAALDRLDAAKADT